MKLSAGSVVLNKSMRIAELEEEKKALLYALELAHPHMCECENADYVLSIIESHQ